MENRKLIDLQEKLAHVSHRAHDLARQSAEHVDAAMSFNKTRNMTYNWAVDERKSTKQLSTLVMEIEAITKDIQAMIDMGGIRA